jgi:hypothetical protein
LRGLSILFRRITTFRHTAAKGLMECHAGLETIQTVLQHQNLSGSATFLFIQPGLHPGCTGLIADRSPLFSLVRQLQGPLQMQAFLLIACAPQRDCSLPH